MAGYNKTLEKVKEHLGSNESIDSSVFGLYKANVMGSDMERKGILAVTGTRVILFGKKLFGHDLESIPFSRISSVETSKGFTGHQITIHASGNDIKMKWINKGDVEQFVQAIESRIGKNEPQSKESDTPASTDIPSMISKLSDLKDKGVLSEDEFNSKKAELLAKM